MYLRKRKAQGILEYTLLLGAIVAVVLVVLMGNGGLAGKTKATYDQVGNTMGSSANQMGGYGVFNNGTSTAAPTTTP